MKPTVLLLCGLPCAGKSALAEALIPDGYTIISLNEINHERGLGLDGLAVASRDWQETHHVALTRMRSLVQAGHSVVWDDSNYAAFIRDPIFEAALEAGADPLVVYVDVPVELARQRAISARASGDLSCCPPDEFERVAKHFERPCCAVRLDGTARPEQAVHLLRQVLRREPSEEFAALAPHS